MQSTIRAMARRTSRILLFAGLALVVGLAGYLLMAAAPESPSLAMPQTVAATPHAAKGAAAFAGGGFGGISQTSLETNAVPFKLVAAALVMDEQASDPTANTDLATLRRVMQRFGFLYPESVEGMPIGMRLPLTETRSAEKPLGMTYGFIAPLGGTRVEVANLGCAACHAGVSYLPDGTPEPGRAVLGMPNTSLDLESYTQAIFTALRRHAGDPALLTMADTLFPQMSWQERASLRWIVLPLARSRLETLAGASRALPFPNGLPGATNGVAALKLQMGTPLLEGGPGDRGIVSIPDLALRQRRNSLLADGVLYPHMSVFDNMAFGMKLAGQDKAERDRRVREAAEMLQLTPYLERLPRQLSGGQRQRVAIGRAIVRDPRVFLFDEPLSNLDAALRVATRLEIAKLHRSMHNTTMIYVTHDQVEAMTLADRICVLRDGVVEQIGTPLELYESPNSLFVAGFIGSPKMNFLDGRFSEPHGAHTIGIRAEHLTIETEGRWQGSVVHSEMLGSDSYVYVDIGGGEPLVVRQEGTATLRPGETVSVSPDDHELHRFDRDGRAIGRGLMKGAA